MVQPSGSFNQTGLKSSAQRKCECVSSLLDIWRGTMWRGARPNSPGEADQPRRFPHFASFLVHLLLNSQLIQNLWNSLEIRKIYMEHGGKFNLFSKSWWSKCEIMVVNNDYLIFFYLGYANKIRLANAGYHLCSCHSQTILLSQKRKSVVIFFLY